MKYFLIAGEASGDLHASKLMEQLRQNDGLAEFCFIGGDMMSAVGGIRIKHYRDLSYMGFIPVIAHLHTILKNMRQCKLAIRRWRPDVVILVDYPGFNLDIASFVRRHHLCPVYYYISPKIWAWREGRIRKIRRNVDHLFSILPFEVDFYERKHHYPIDYVGNPTLDEVHTFIAHQGEPQPDKHTIALLPGSRKQEIADNLSRMLLAAAESTQPDDKLVIAMAPAIEHSVYEHILKQSGLADERISLLPPGRTYELLSHARAALVTSGTATLETALFGVPQVVCYYIGAAPVMRVLRKLFLKVPYISLVNLICGREVVPEMVAADMNPAAVGKQLRLILADGDARRNMLSGYADMRRRLGQPGAPERAAKLMLKYLSENGDN